MNAHTAGPWHWDGPVLDGSDGSVLYIGGGYDGLWGGDEPSPADAALIEAAPTMLAALQALLVDGIADRTDGVRDWHYCPSCQITADLAAAIEHEADCPAGMAEAAVRQALGMTVA